MYATSAAQHTNGKTHQQPPHRTHSATATLTNMKCKTSHGRQQQHSLANSSNLHSTPPRLATHTSQHSKHSTTLYGSHINQTPGSKCTQRTDTAGQNTHLTAHRDRDRETERETGAGRERRQGGKRRANERNEGDDGSNHSSNNNMKARGADRLCTTSGREIRQAADTNRGGVQVQRRRRRGEERGWTLTETKEAAGREQRQR